MDIGKNFPVADYYRENILDAVTISRTGGWWSAILLIKDPKTQRPFISLYRWEQKNGEWKRRSHYNIRHQKDLDLIFSFKGKLID